MLKQDLLSYEQRHVNLISSANDARNSSGPDVLMSRGVPRIRPGWGRRVLICTYIGEISVERGGGGVRGEDD